MSRDAERLLGIFFSAVLFIATASFTLWQNAHVAVLWDLSYLLDSAWRFSLGQVPYRDLPFAHAPLTFLLHVAIIRLFGRIYLPHLICAALEAGVATVLTWRLLLRMLGSLPQREAVAALLAAPLVFLGIYGVYPHPIYDSDCVLAILFALWLLMRASSSIPRNAVAGAACVLPLFFKQNIGLAFLAAVLLVCAITALLRLRERLAVAPQLAFFAGAVVALVAALAAIQATVGLHNYFYWTVTFARLRRLPGVAVVLGAYRQASLLWSLPAVVAGLALLRRVERVPTRGLKAAAVLLLTAPFFWDAASLFWLEEASDRADRLLSLWPHLLILSAALLLWSLRPSRLKVATAMTTLVPLILLATIHGTFLSQQLWGSTYAIWPLLMLLIAVLLAESAARAVAVPVAAVVSASLVLCGGLYAASHERLSYIHLDGALTRAALPELRGLATPGPWLPEFEEFVRFADAEIPANDGIVLLPGEVPFYFATGRTPRFPVLLFDPAVDPYSPEETVVEARARNIRWLIVTRNLQLAGSPYDELPAITEALERDFVLYRTLTNYEVWKRR